MPSKIQILPNSLANKISAGEVVNRPESAAKELIENSIDAGASEITLIIKDAGKSLIRVIDNGSGMTEEDSVMAFQRHSTSKISTYDDLENLSTLGFRGEALASICSISQIEIQTRIQEDELGTCIKIEGNEIQEISKVSCSKGTSISIKNIFFNTPGRRNFLKSNQTEFKHIYESFVKLAVSHPDISFCFINNEETLFDVKAADLKQRIADLFTSGFTESLIPVEYGNSLVRITGFISKPSFTKKSKQDQYFYLNNRFFTNKNLNFAVYSGYDDLVEKGDYPSFFLFIEIDPRKVDVNVHPSKLEVKFEDEGAIFGTIRKAVREALRSADIIFDVSFSNKLPLEKQPESFSYSKSESAFTAQKTKAYSIPKNNGAKIHSIFEASKPVLEDEITDILHQPEKKAPNIFEHVSKTEPEPFNVWQYQHKYIMCQTETGLMIIDQHAAHERILYEKALLWLDSQSSFSQQLLIPIKVQLSKIDFQILKSLEKEFFNLGFNFKEQKNDTVELYGLPSDVKTGSEEKIIQQLIDQFKEYELKLNLDKRDNLAKSFACRSAIKAGDKLQTKEMIGLIDQLFASQMPYVCPHGRPTIIRITTDELDKRFSRT